MFNKIEAHSREPFFLDIEDSRTLVASHELTWLQLTRIEGILGIPLAEYASVNHLGLVKRNICIVQCVSVIAIRVSFVRRTRHAIAYMI